MAEYVSRGVIADAILWDVGGGTFSASKVSEPVADKRGYVVGNVAPHHSNGFQTTSADSDRRSLLGHPGRCPRRQQDRRLPRHRLRRPAQRRRSLPDHRRGRTAAVRQRRLPRLQLLRLGAAQPQDRRQRHRVHQPGRGDAQRLGAGQARHRRWHAYRAALRGTLAHNGVTVAAFPVNTFPAGSGTFTFANRPVPGLSGDTQGTWTFSSTALDSGVLSTWSVHN